MCRQDLMAKRSIEALAVAQGEPIEVIAPLRKRPACPTNAILAGVWVSAVNKKRAA